MSLTPPTKNREPEYGNIVLVDNDGCDASDYPAEVKGSIALIKRGACSFGAKSEKAGQAGAIAAIIYNNEKGDVHGTLGTPTPDHVATFGISEKYGEKVAKQLKDGEKVDAIVYIDGEVRTIMTSNIVAQTSGGDQDNCVMLGGHSDSVPEGPGINDDGSGSISVLEVALRLTDYSVNNCVRFAWWAAEEEGLLGSDFYVASLSEEENKKIRLFMDYDMMGSPNYAYQVYNASNEVNPVGSGDLKQLYIDWYVDQGLNYTLIPFDGRSDYDGFIRGGIPAGGIATGAEGVKTEEEEAMFGGKAGDWYDPCYHQLCDDTSNVDLTAWEVNTKVSPHKSLLGHLKSLLTVRTAHCPLCCYLRPLLRRLPQAIRREDGSDICSREQVPRTQAHHVAFLTHVDYVYNRHPAQLIDQPSAALAVQNRLGNGRPARSSN